MSDELKPSGKGDSLWGEVARMEAEVVDPEEDATSVYDMAVLREEAAAIIRAGRSRAGTAATTTLRSAEAPAPITEEEEEEDTTSVLDVAAVASRGRRRLENADTLPVGAELQKPEQPGDESPSIEVAELDMDDMDEMDGEERAPVDDARRPADAMPAALPPEPVSTPAAEPTRSYTPFLVLVVVGFTVGYIAVSFFGR